MISDRIYSQLLLASYRDLASFVQATPVSLQLAAQPPPSGLFAELVKQVQDMSVYRLTKEIDERQLKEKEDRATLAREVPRDELALLLLRAMWLEYVNYKQVFCNISVFFYAKSFSLDPIEKNLSFYVTFSFVFLPRLLLLLFVQLSSHLVVKLLSLNLNFPFATQIPSSFGKLTLPRSI